MVSDISATSVDLDLTLTLGDDDDVSEDIDDESSFDRRQSSMMSLPPLPEQLEQEARRQAEREERLERVERVLRTLRHAAARRFRDVAAMLRVPLLFGSLLLLDCASLLSKLTNRIELLLSRICSCGINIFH